MLVCIAWGHSTNWISRSSRPGQKLRLLYHIDVLGARALPVGPSEPGLDGARVEVPEATLNEGSDPAYRLRVEDLPTFPSPGHTS